MILGSHPGLLVWPRSDRDLFNWVDLQRHGNAPNVWPRQSLSRDGTPFKRSERLAEVQRGSPLKNAGCLRPASLEVSSRMILPLAGVL